MGRKGLKRRMLHWLVTLVVGFFVIGFALRLFENRLIYFPMALEPGTLDVLLSQFPLTKARVEEVSFPTEDKEVLSGWLGTPKDPRAWLLWFHGNAGNISHRWEDFYRFVNHERLGVLLFDYRGYGDSTGSPDEAGVYADARAALAFLEARGIPAPEVWLLGRSIGGSVAVDLALERPVKGLVIESTFTSVREMARRAVPWFPAGWFAKSRFATDEKIGKLEVPILHFHGRHDEIVPFAHGERLSRLVTSPRYEFVSVPTGHNDLSVVMGDAYFEKVVEFVTK